MDLSQALEVWWVLPVSLCIATIALALGISGAAAMAGELSVSDIGNTLHAYPTLSESVRYACQEIM
jgi:hypothetical protein